VGEPISPAGFLLLAHISIAVGETIVKRVRVAIRLDLATYLHCVLSVMRVFYRKSWSHQVGEPISPKSWFLDQLWRSSKSFLSM
jgi:hypothetical protein